MNELREKLEKFLTDNNQPLEFEQLTQDASTREYFRVKWNGQTAIACVYPFNDLCLGQFEACLDVTNVFRSENLPVAEIFTFDAEKQIIIHEDFGNTILRDVLATADQAERERLLDKAISFIARIQAATDKAFELDSIASKLKFDEEKLFWELNFFKTHYFESYKKSALSENENSALTAEFVELSKELENRAEVLCHRDFHAANLMLDKENQLRIIDHQDARIGSTTYDLVSLLLDRVLETPDENWLESKKRLFLSEREKLNLNAIDFNEFDAEFQLQTIQRCLKAVGTFSFQSTFRGKTYFIPFIEPMLKIVLEAARKLNRFPTLREIIKKEL